MLALVPVLLLGLVWFLSHKTGTDYEDVEPKPPIGTTGTGTSGAAPAGRAATRQ